MIDKIFSTKKYLFLSFLIVWTIFLSSFLVWNYFIQKSTIIKLVRSEANSSFQKDVIYREWNAIHGGLYAPVTDESPANEYLKVEERDIITPKGKKLTLINPAYMTRQVHELAEKKYSVHGHITSLKPIRAENRADEWEAKALKFFENGTDEFYEITYKENNQCFRFMRPLFVKQACMKCHAKQGYKIGDIRGGISIKIPMVSHNSQFYSQILVLSLTYFAIWIVGLILGFIIIDRRQKHIEENEKLNFRLSQAQKMESIGTMAGGVAHDFNNLLTVINGYSEMALSHLEPGDPLYKDIMSIFKAGNRAKNITNQLLAFSRKQVYSPEILDINQVVSSIENMTRRLVDENIEFKTVFIDNISKIKADKTQIEQIFINLIVNARDALRVVKEPDYHKIITIETGQSFLDKEFVERHPGSMVGMYAFFAVSDNGIGMDESIKQKVFEPFFTTKDKSKGTGLGLAMVYGIVKQNRGCVYVYSEPGQGTMFKIYWPVSEENIVAKKKSAESNIMRGSETILIVEDEKEVCDLAVNSLKSLGYKVLKAENGRIAFDLIKSQRPKLDLIITDLVMPELNGKDFIEKVQEFYPTNKVIYVSGYTDNHIVHNGLLEEGVNFIHKPYSIKVLAMTIRKILDE